MDSRAAPVYVHTHVHTQASEARLGLRSSVFWTWRKRGERPTLWTKLC